MNETKAARLKACRRCLHRVIRPGAGWDWPKCDGGPAAVDISDAFLAGPDSNCPLNQWQTSATARASQQSAASQSSNDADDTDKAKNQDRREAKAGGVVDRNPVIAVHPPSSAESPPAGRRAGVSSPPAGRRAGVAHCVFASPAKCCIRKFECRRQAEIVRVVTAEECNASCPRCVDRLRIGAVITAWDEGAEVRRTVESLVASVSPDTELRVIVMDDASEDGSCKSLSNTEGTENAEKDKVSGETSKKKPAVVVDPTSAVAVLRDLRALRVEIAVLRHEVPLGIGRSRNDGWAMAQQLGCNPPDSRRVNVVSFHDAHMRFMPGDLEALARRALQERCIVSAGSQPFKREGDVDQKEGCRLWGCDLFYNANAGLQPKWLRMAEPPEEEWMRSPCIMGAGYVMSADTARELEAATGALWEDTAGRAAHLDRPAGDMFTARLRAAVGFDLPSSVSLIQGAVLGQ